MFNKRFFTLLIVEILFLSLASAFSHVAIVKTPAEETGYTQYTQHEETSRFLSHIDYLSEELTIRIIGRTQESKEYPSKDLYLCIINEEGINCPLKLNRRKPTFLLVASQHGNEQSAKEAALWLIRDLVSGELNYMLKKINFLIIPQANPYGNRFDQRGNEQALDLNRDHIKLEAPEVETIHHVFRAWMPDVTMDVHEKGDDFYRVSIGCVSNANIHPSLLRFSRNKILTHVKKKLKKRHITFHEYLITQPLGVNSSAGVSYRQDELERKEMMKRYSTTDLNDGRNSLGIYETLSFIQEGASRHDIQTLKERTRWQYWGIRYFAEEIAQHGEEIISLVESLRSNLLERAKIFSQEDLVHLKMEYARDDKEPELIIRKFDRSDSLIRGVLKVDKKAGDALRRTELFPYPYPSKYELVEEVVKNWFPNVRPTLSISRPLGYIIPGKYQDITETLLRHDIKVEMFTRDIPLKVEVHKINEIIPAEYDYLPPQKIEVETQTLQTIIKRGDFYVSCAQEGANLIPCILEPHSQYGLIRYWKYKLVPEVEDFFPFLRLTEATKLPLVPYKNWKM